MSKTLASIIAAIALALGALCAVQWYRESGLRQQAEAREKAFAEKEQKISALEKQLAQWDDEFKRFGGRMKELKESDETNRVALATAQAAQRKAELEAERAGKQVAEYEKAVDQQNDNLKRQNQALEQQSELLKKISAERDQLTAQLNARVQEYNSVVEKYNALAKQLEASAGKSPK